MTPHVITVDTEPWTQTFTGKVFTPLNPQVRDIDIRDIAHALARVGRYTGHTREFLSVSQHSVMVSDLCPRSWALEGLLHDASEAYLNDVSRPLKESPRFAFYREAEALLEQAIAQRFNLLFPWPPCVKLADVRVLATEKRDLIGPSPRSWAAWLDGVQPLPEKIRPLLPEDAEDLFLNRYNELTHQRHHGPFTMRLRRAGRAIRRGVRGIVEAFL